MSFPWIHKKLWKFNFLLRIELNEKAPIFFISCVPSRRRHLCCLATFMIYEERAKSDLKKRKTEIENFSFFSHYENFQLLLTRRNQIFLEMLLLRMLFVVNLSIGIYCWAFIVGFYVKMVLWKMPVCLDLSAEEVSSHHRHHNKCHLRDSSNNSIVVGCHKSFFVSTGNTARKIDFPDCYYHFTINLVSY